MIDTANVMWFILFYAVGTAFGLWFGYNKGITVATEGVVDNLIDAGYLKTRGSSSNLEILKYDEE
jgi:hypothetical protein|tara:strand:+ start:324 stop:518 length:195 start_codon:yes stop_codon:yes gene_type:complete